MDSLRLCKKDITCIIFPNSSVPHHNSAKARPLFYFCALFFAFGVKCA